MRVSNVDKHTNEDELPVQLCNYVDVYYNDQIDGNLPYMKATVSPAEAERFRLKHNDVVITKDSEAWNDIAVPSLVVAPPEDLVCGYHLAILRPSGAIDGTYLARVMQSPTIAHQLHVAAQGITRYGLTHNDILSASVPLPPLDEQAAIVRYLDHANELINRYISAKERLIALLEEQRQAVIHQAITRGIDQGTLTSPSAIPLFDQIPSHWNTKRLRNVADVRFSNVDKHTRDNEIGVKLCNYVDVYNNDYITANIPFMPATAAQGEIDRFRLQVGDVLITKDSETWNDIGVPALVKFEQPDLICGYHIALLRPKPNTLTGRYLFRVLQDAAIAYQLHVGANGVTRFGLPQERIKSVAIPTPPLEEQQRIADFLDESTASIEAKTTRYRDQIRLVREYRTRLITDAVTGQIDVRAADIQLPE